jgi:hypothetical protein
MMVIDQPERKEPKAEFWRTRPLLVPFPPPGNSNTDPVPSRTASGAAEIKCLALHSHELRHGSGFTLIGNFGTDDQG